LDAQRGLLALYLVAAEVAVDRHRPALSRVTVSRSRHWAHVMRFALTAIFTPFETVTQVL